MSIYDLSMFDMHPKADERFVVRGEKYRITVLTEQLLRLEYSEDGVFEDRATRFAFNRAFDTPEFESYHDDGMLHIVTKHLHLSYNEQKFSDYGIQIAVDGTKFWSYGLEVWSLGGTTCTLDQVNGACKLDDGLLSAHHRFYAYDDSKTIAIDEDGWPVPVTGDRIDLYFFGYNWDFEKCIQDFYKLSSPVPLLPRYALGNWWSRYHDYSDKEYYKLLDDFKAKNIPFSVAVIDMDWHITKTPDPIKYGDGWTGYTWNKDLFPTPKEFLAELKSRGLRNTLNLHPRDGIRAFEDVYPAMCKRLGKDPSKERPVEFDASSKKFMEAYFDTVLNPMEDDGVNFWWIDWQQTGGKRIGGYDVLWMLNHCHYTDSARRGERPLTFSRYAGVGSHRYPIGFSGDTHVTWDSLDFQPYFTSTAANVGYSWWSHDIGGHMAGFHDCELQNRWVQLGVFSPIMRLHSTANFYNSKEPWNYGNYEGIMCDFLRLRHRLVPYIFTMMYRGTEEGIPMVRPIYHKYPQCVYSRFIKNEYLFGDMIVAMITKPKDSESGLSKTQAWLPRGTYVDFFSNRVYRGYDNGVDFYRFDDTVPVLVKAGSVIPLAVLDGENGVENPKALELYVYGGDSGEFTMVEDNGKVGSDLEVTRTKYIFEYGRESKLSFTALGGKDIPLERDYSVKFIAFSKPEALYAVINGVKKELSYEYDEHEHTVSLSLGKICADDSVTVVLVGDGVLPANDIKYALRNLLSRAEIKYDDKPLVEAFMLRRDAPFAAKLQQLLSLNINEYACGAVLELMLSDRTDE